MYVAKRYLQQKSLLHYQGDMGLFLILVFFFLFCFVFFFFFLILVDCSDNPFEVLSPPRQKEGYVEKCVYYRNNFYNFYHNLFMWRVVRDRNKILSLYKSIISPLISHHITKLWQSCKSNYVTKLNLCTVSRIIPFHLTRVTRPELKISLQGFLTGVNFYSITCVLITWATRPTTCTVSHKLRYGRAILFVICLFFDGKAILFCCSEFQRYR